MAKSDSGADAGQRWAKELVDRVGKAVKEARRGKSAAWLSDRTAQFGYRVSPTVIAKLDSGHRGSVLSVQELIVLAAALDTSPVNLIYPGPYGGKVEVLPDIETTELVAVGWWAGADHWWDVSDEDWATNDPARMAHVRWTKNTEGLQLGRQLYEAQREVSRLLRRLRMEMEADEEKRDEDRIFYLRTQIEHLDQFIQYVEDSLKQEDGDA